MKRRSGSPSAAWTTWASQTFSERVLGAAAISAPTLTISTRSMPPGALYSTVSPAVLPMRAWPSGALGETTGMSPGCSSMEPTKKSWVSSSSSPS